MLLREKERYQRIMIGVPDDAEVDLSLVRLPDDALMFPALPSGGEDINFTKPRDPHTFTKQFRRRAKSLGFTGFTFHNLRHTHSTLLLDRNVPVHRVAERIGDDPAILLPVYAKLTQRKNETMSDAVNALATGIFGS